MKRRWKVSLTIVLAVVIVAAGSFAFVLYKDRTYVPSPEYERTSDGPARVLVVYYSRSGNTEGVAREVARHFDADILRIEAPRYTLDYGGWRHAANDADAEVTRTPIEHPDVNLEDYDLIALGSPIWWYRPAPPLWTFVENHDFAGRRVVLFNTFNSRFKQEHIDRFRRQVEESHGVFLDHVYVRRGRVVWQKTPDEARREIREALEDRFPGGRVDPGSRPVGSNPLGSNPVGSNPVGSNPVGSNPVAPNPVASNPVASNPVASNPVASNPVGSNPVASNPVGSNPEE